jgi:hypothetical protein
MYLKKEYMEHDEFCNCEDCWWARGKQEVCATCGCVVGVGCPCNTENVENATPNSLRGRV